MNIQFEISLNEHIWNMAVGVNEGVQGGMWFGIHFYRMCLCTMFLSVYLEDKVEIKETVQIDT